MQYNIPKNVSLMALERRVHDVFNRIELFRLSHEESLNLISTELTNPINVKTKSGYKHNNYIKGYLSGLIAGHRSLIWSKVEFIYIVDNIMYSTDKDSCFNKTDELYKAGRGRELVDIEGHHYWKGTTKRYT